MFSLRSILKPQKLVLASTGVTRCLSSNVPTTKLFINGKFVESKTDRWIDNLNPVSEITNQQYSSVA
jgi:malonate-semialdehyde dehydrogenase (acetylating)/methylmalonate-semialdehyde dehydrogenase